MEDSTWLSGSLHLSNSRSQDRDWEFTSHKLLGLSGTVHTSLADFDEGGHPDIFALVSQEWEEVHLFRNFGHGEFRGTVVLVANKRRLHAHWRAVERNPTDPDSNFNLGDLLLSTGNEEDGLRCIRNSH